MDSPDPLSLAALDAMPHRVAALPQDKHGMPIPWCVPVVDGEPDFTAAIEGRATQAWKERRCWICGCRPIARNAVYVVAPVAALKRVASEPPCHLGCAGYVVTRRPAILLPCAGAGDTTPGVWLLWTTRDDAMVPFGRGVLFDLGNPEACVWYRAGRPATRREATDAVAAAVCLLRPEAEREGEAAMADLLEAVQHLLRRLPPEEPSQTGPGPG